MRKKNQLTRIKDPLYRVDIYVLFEPDVDKAGKIIRDVFKPEIANRVLGDVSAAGWGAITARVHDNVDNACDSFLVWFSKPKQLYMVHEAQHVTLQVLTESGIKVSPEADEAFCYYIQWLYEQFTEVAKWYRKIKKKGKK